MIFMAGGNAYSVIHDHKNGWNPEAFRERYSEVLERFDYIVGDWGYSQLRLRGFYKDGHPRATKESTISSLFDYINEYCNFGCAYFVLTKLDAKSLTPEELAQSQQLVATAATAATVAVGEGGEQTTETAATAAAATPATPAPTFPNGMIMRWPLKERPGGPARVPNVTVSAVARAAAESAERRKEQHGGSHQRGGHRQGHDGGSNRHGKPSHGGDRGDRRQGQGSGGGDRHQERGGHQGQRQGRGGQQGGGESRGPRPQQQSQGGGGNHRQNNGENRQPQEAAAHPNAESARNNSRWPGKSRRRKSFGGKQSPRPEGAPRGEAGNNPPRASE